MSDFLLRADAIEAGYSVPVVGPLSFEIRPGEVIGLAGPNGAGKSTLIKAIADHARIFSGKVVRRPGLSLAWMEQQPARFAEMPFDGRDYLRFAESSDSNAPQYLQSWLSQRVDSLSGGQFQLLSCWTVLGNDADLVMLDEPTNNLDKQSEKTLSEFLMGDHGERGVLLVSHDHAFLDHVCDRVVEVGQ